MRIVLHFNIHVSASFFPVTLRIHIYALCDIFEQINVVTFYDIRIGNIRMHYNLGQCMMLKVLHTNLSRTPKSKKK